MAQHTITGYTANAQGRAYLLQVDGGRWTFKRAFFASKAGDTFIGPTALITIRFVAPNATSLFICTQDVAIPSADTLTGVPQVNLVQASALGQ